MSRCVVNIVNLLKPYPPYSQSAVRLLPRSIVTKLVQRKFTGAPWQGPLPSPRVSPPRTLGDCVAKATLLSAGAHGTQASSHRRPSLPAARYQGNSAGSARGALASSSRRPSSPARLPLARDERNSKFFETSNLQYSDPDFPPLSPAGLPVELTVCSASVATGKADRATRKIEIGPGKVFRPTQGLCALFRRIGTRKIKKPSIVAADAIYHAVIVIYRSDAVFRGRGS